MRYEINVNEKTEFNHKLVIESNAKDTNKILDRAEKEKSLRDIIHALKENNCKVIQANRDEKGKTSNIEIDDMKKL